MAVVAGCIPTFNRAEILLRSVELLRAHLSLSGGRITYLIGCDGSDDTPAQLARLRLSTDELIIFAAPSGGIGKNLNRLMRYAREAMRADCIMSLDDDHHLVKPLSLDRHVNKLLTDTGSGRIHLLMEALHDEHFDTYQFRAELDRSHYWRIAWDSPEHFIMSFRPNIIHAERWLSVMGYLPEGLRTGETEYEYARHCKQMGLSGAGVDVYVPLTAPGAETWEHNNGGVSWNQQGL
jgi:hypothetical protein